MRKEFRKFDIRRLGERLVEGKGLMGSKKGEKK